MKAVINYSGGLSSHLAAHRAIEKWGAKECKLVFADTSTEDGDLYRFVKEGAAALACELVWLQDGRTIWEVFKDEKFLGNSRIDPCSKILKRLPIDRWVKKNAPDAFRVFGFTQCESQRFERVKARCPLAVAPLMEPPTVLATEVRAEFEELFPNIKVPRLYDLGAKHNNCGGGCVKAGQKHFAWLLKTLPDVYADWEDQEQKLRDQLGDVSILIDRRGGGKHRLTLRQFRINTQLGVKPRGDDYSCQCFDPNNE